MFNTINLQRLNPALLQRLRGQGPIQSAGGPQTQRANPYADAFERGSNAVRQGVNNARSGLSNAGAEAANNFRLSGHLGVENSAIDWDRGGRKLDTPRTGSTRSMIQRLCGCQVEQPT